MYDARNMENWHGNGVAGRQTRGLISRRDFVPISDSMSLTDDETCTMIIPS